MATRVNAKQANTIKEQDVHNRFIERVADVSLRRELRKLRASNPDVTLQKARQEALQWQEDEEEEGHYSHPSARSR
jgi:NACalpha-BTF3-like transcription factor